MEFRELAGKVADGYSGRIEAWKLHLMHINNGRMGSKENTRRSGDKKESRGC